MAAIKAGGTGTPPPACGGCAGIEGYGCCMLLSVRLSLSAGLLLSSVHQIDL